MLENQLRLLSSCALLCWVGASACANERATFSDVDPAHADSALQAGATNSPRAPGASADPAHAAAGSMSLPPSVSMAPSGTLMCGNAPCQCNNGEDDDGDGKVDGFDVECTGGIDDDESSFATGIPGDNRDPKWQDCFFDGNSGAGDDRCRYPTECLTGELSLTDEACAVTQACRDNCLPRTPGGCDCFGCCAVALPGGGEVNVMLTDTCSAEKIGDAQACPACVVNPECAVPPSEPNVPEPNEPATPDAGPPVFSCGGREQCDEAGSCAPGQFCSQGCCLNVIE